MKPILFGLFHLLVLVSCADAQELRIPNGIDFSRLKKIDAQYAKGGDSKYSHKLTVYAIMTAIDGKNAHMLFPSNVGKGLGTADQLMQRFKSTISSTNRFDFRDQRQSDIMEGIVVEAMLTAANQNLEDYKAFLKSVTTLRMSVAIKDLESGAVMRSKNFNAVYGSAPEEGTVVKNRSLFNSTTGVCQDRVVCNNLANDYDKALQELFDNLTAYIEKTFRPIAKVSDVDDGEITMLGSVLHGFNPEEELVVFRARHLTNEEGNPLPPAIKPVAIVSCSVGDSLSCREIKKGKNGDIQKGDYAVPSDKMLKLREPD